MNIFSAILLLDLQTTIYTVAVDIVSLWAFMNGGMNLEVVCCKKSMYRGVSYVGLGNSGLVSWKAFVNSGMNLEVS